MLKDGRLKRGEGVVQEGRWWATGKGEKGVGVGVEIMIGVSEEEGRKCKAEAKGVDELRARS